MSDTNPFMSAGANETGQHLSRRQRRELMRRQHGDPGYSGRGGRRVLLWIGGLVILVLIAWGMVKLSAVSPGTSADGTLANAVTSSDNVEGPASASVTLLEYADFQCPACASYYPIVKQLLLEPDLKGKVRFVYRYFPLATLHPNAVLSARAAQAAALQGKFWLMHDILFEHQTIWSPMSDTAARQTFAQYAATIGLDAARFTRDLDSDEVKDRVNSDERGGESSGVTSTPTFFVNGLQMPMAENYDQFHQYIASASHANQ